jgi:glycosyltransferase involved in cell wall biosynthesis
MKILIINWQDWNNPMAGGAEVYLYEIFSRFIQRGHEVTLLVSRAADQSRYEQIAGFDIYRIGQRSNFNFFAPYGLKALIKHNHFDIIIDDLNKIPFYSAVFTRVPVLPVVMHIFLKTIYRETNPILATYVYLGERMIPHLYPVPDCVAISHSTADDLRDIGMHSRLHVVECGIPIVKKSPKHERVKNLVAYVGRVKRYKSIDHFIRAMVLVSRTHDIKVMVIGDGDAKEDLMKLAAQSSIDVEFTGFVDEQKKNEVYASARVIVQPSVKEGWGLTAIEAQSFGTPVVCADSPGLREVVKHAETGYLYKYGNIEALAHKTRLLLDDETLWRRLSHAATKWADTFSWDLAADKFETVCRSVVQKGTP